MLKGYTWVVFVITILGFVSRIGLLGLGETKTEHSLAWGAIGAAINIVWLYFIMTQLGWL